MTLPVNGAAVAVPAPTSSSAPGATDAGAHVEVDPATEGKGTGVKGRPKASDTLGWPEAEKETTTTTGTPPGMKVAAAGDGAAAWSRRRPVVVEALVGYVCGYGGYGAPFSSACVPSRKKANEQPVFWFITTPMDDTLTPGAATIGVGWMDSDTPPMENTDVHEFVELDGYHAVKVTLAMSVAEDDDAAAPEKPPPTAGARVHPPTAPASAGAAAVRSNACLAGASGTAVWRGPGVASVAYPCCGGDCPTKKVPGTAPLTVDTQPGLPV